MVLLSDAMIVVKEVFGPRLVLQQEGGEGSCVRRAEMGGSPIAFSQLIVPLRLSPCTPKSFIYKASLINFTASFGVSLGTFPAVTRVECLPALV